MFYRVLSSHWKFIIQSDVDTYPNNQNSHKHKNNKLAGFISELLCFLCFLFIVLNRLYSWVELFSSLIISRYWSKWWNRRHNIIRYLFLSYLKSCNYHKHPSIFLQLLIKLCLIHMKRFKFLYFIDTMHNIFICQNIEQICF
jgi:hypothetical protein